MASPSNSDPATGEDGRRNWQGLLSRILSYGRGRPFGLIVLLGCLAVLLAQPEPVRRFQNAGFDNLQRLFPRQAAVGSVIIVAVDDASIAKEGQWPWPRSVMAKLIGKIAADKPAAMYSDILWSESDRLSPEAKAALSGLPDNDALLAAAIRGAKITLGSAGLPERGAPGPPLPWPPVQAAGGDPGPAVTSYQGALRNLPAIESSARGHGLMSIDPGEDGVVRRVPLIARIGRQLVPGVVVETLRLAANAPIIRAISDEHGLTDVQVGPLVIPAQRDGTAWLHFGPHDDARFRSAADVLDGKVPPDDLQDAIVLIGVTGIGLLDKPITPLGSMAGVEVLAQFIESALTQNWLMRPEWAVWGEGLIMAILGLVLINFLPMLSPRWQAGLAMVTLAPMPIISTVLFSRVGLLFDGATPMVGIGLTLLMMVGAIVAEHHRQRQVLARALEAQRLSAAKMAGELEAARRIQMGILPKPESLARDVRFELAATIEPAKEVGGDLYDFFMLDPDHLFLLVGDVTGKGVPASLFMALSKSLCKSAALRHGVELATAVFEANADISRDNSEALFVTMFAGIVDLNSGIIEYCVAGHDAPYRFHPGTGVHPVPLSSELSGPPLCVMDDFPFEMEKAQLEPGDVLFTFTDGVSEAYDVDCALYGHERLTGALVALPESTTASETLVAARADLAKFVGPADQSDDITILTFRWLGPQAAA